MPNFHTVDIPWEKVLPEVLGPLKCLFWFCSFQISIKAFRIPWWTLNPTQSFFLMTVFSKLYTMAVWHLYSTSLFSVNHVQAFTERKIPGKVWQGIHISNRILKVVLLPSKIKNRYISLFSTKGFLQAASEPETWEEHHLLKQSRLCESRSRQCQLSTRLYQNFQPCFLNESRLIQSHHLFILHTLTHSKFTGQIINFERDLQDRKNFGGFAVWDCFLGWGRGWEFLSFMRMSRWIKERNVQCKRNCWIGFACWAVSTCTALAKASCSCPGNLVGPAEEQSITGASEHILEKSWGSWKRCTIQEFNERI